MSLAPAQPQRLTVRSIPVQDPGDLLARLPHTSAFAWTRRGEGLIGWGECARIRVGPGVGRFARAETKLRHLLAGADVSDSVGVAGSGPVAFGSFTFDPGAEGSVLVVPRVVMGRRGGKAWLTTIGDGDGLTGIRPVTPPGDIRWDDGALPMPDWMRAVGEAVTAIRAGRLNKVVLSRDVYARASNPIDPRSLLDRLCRRFPDCYAFSCAGLVGATPELLIRREGDRLASLVLAGSARRGVDSGEDRDLGTSLLASAKDVEEHELAVDSVRAALASHCSSLDVEPHPSLLVLANVQHLATCVSGTLAGDASALEVAASLHPTAAVCGSPAEEALALIRFLENMQRGRYAGPVGWLDGRGNGEWGIALRCAELQGHMARLFAGNGIVAGSDPEAELAETQTKLRAMQDALEE